MAFPVTAAATATTATTAPARSESSVLRRRRREPEDSANQEEQPQTVAPALRDRARSKPSWRTVPDGPKSVVAGMVGECASADLIAARKVRALLPRAYTTIKATRRNLARALRVPTSLRADLIEALATQDGWVKVALHEPSGWTARVFGAALSQNRAPGWYELDVYGRFEPEEEFELFLNNLADNTTLRSLSIGSTSGRTALSLAHCTALGNMLRAKGCALRKLEVRRQLEPAGARRLVADIARNRTIRSLFLLLGMPREGSADIAAALGNVLREGLVPLEKLDISRAAWLGDAGFAIVAQGLAENFKLRELHSASCQLGPKAAAGLAKALRSKRPALEVLVANFNPGLGDAGGATLAKALVRNSTLVELRLPGCNIGPATSAALCEVLQSDCSALKKLDLKWNAGLGDAGAGALVCGLANNSTLRELYLSECRVGLQTATLLRDALCNERSALGVLILDFNPNLGQAGASALLAQGVAQSNVLKKLGLRHCGLDSELSGKLRLVARRSNFRVDV